MQSLVGIFPWKKESLGAETQLRVDNFPESVVRQAVDFMRLKYEVARTGKGCERIQEIMRRAGERWLAYTNPPATLERLRQVYDLIMTYDRRRSGRCFVKRFESLIRFNPRFRVGGMPLPA